MCDAMMGSDHRPVSAGIKILVKDELRSCKAANAVLEPTRASPFLPEDACLMKIRIYALQIKCFSPPSPLEMEGSSFITPRSYEGSAFSVNPAIPNQMKPDEATSEESFGSLRSSQSSSMRRINFPEAALELFGSFRSGSSSISKKIFPRDKVPECMIYFPLENEDPLAFVRRSVLKDQALNNNTNSAEVKGLLRARNMQNIHTFKLGGKAEREVLEFRSFVCSRSAR